MKCEICNNEFKPKNKLQKYCCNDCKKRANVLIELKRRSKQRKEEFDKTDKIRKCLICDKEFEIRQQFRRQKYCSEQCSQKAEKLYGGKQERDLDYKNQIRFSGNKYKILERDNYTCQICGNTTQLVVHHKDDSGQSDNPNNDMDNLITLCRRCHINIHKVIMK